MDNTVRSAAPEWASRELAAKDARIAELEAELSRDGDQIVKAFRERYERVEAKIAELETANSEIAIEALRDHRELHARAEQAELELDEMNAIHQRAQLAELAARDAIARAERAEAELKVAREALQGLCDEIELSEDHGEGAHDERCPICVAYREARAAIAERAEADADSLRSTNAMRKALNLARIALKNRDQSKYEVKVLAAIRAALNPSLADGLPPFKPCVVFHEEMRVTEMLLEDCLTIWKPWGPYKGHAVDCGYSEDGRLVGIKIWDDVTSRLNPSPAGREE